MWRRLALLSCSGLLCLVAEGAPGPGLPKIPGVKGIIDRVKNRRGDDRSEDHHHHADVTADSGDDFNKPALSLVAEQIAPEDLIPKPTRRQRKMKERLYENLGSARAAVFPIENHELKKFFMMSGLMFFIIYVYTVVRDTKDTLIVSTCGAEAITFLKVYGVIPASALFMVVYGYMSNHLKKRTLFYVTSLPFFLFYAAFNYLIYPNRHKLQPNIGAAHLPGGLDFLVSLVKNWDFSLFYIISELFGSVGVSVLFWQLANEITKVDEAKRFYPLLGQLANLAPIAAGQTVVLSARMTDSSNKDPFAKSLQLITTFIMVSGGFIALLYKNIMDYVDREKAALAPKGDAEKASAPRKKKARLGMMDSFRFLLTNKYLGCICVLVMAYGLSINFTEVMWKSQVKLLYKDKQKYQQFMGNYSTIMGATTFLIIFAGSQIVKAFGMKVGALITPVMMALLAAPFFGFIIFGGIKSSGVSSPTALKTAVWVGLVQNVLSKSIKYALFDPTKEMAYIPLGREEKVKGKAAIDVLGARIGKSGGALLQQLMVLAYGNIIDAAPLVVGLFYTVILAWLIAANSLGNQFNELTSDKRK